MYGRRVVLGVGGGIAAYKAVELCRRLVDSGAHVTPVLSSGALRFVGEVTFSALASGPARTSLWDDADPVPHVSIGRAADLVVLAPATADLIGAYATGLAHDLLTATLLATRAPVVVCPSMHTEMWDHPAVRDNVERLRSRGVVFVGPATGRLAGGDEGVGRMEEPPVIMAAISRSLAPQDLAGCRVLVTAGGTREPLDAVRYLGNRSSGRQGHALAAEAAARGAEVTLVTAAGGRRAVPGVEVVRVETAQEMADAVLSRSEGVDVVVMAAAVADFRPREATTGKLDKAAGPPDVALEPTVDILAELGRRRRPGQVLVGFAAETGDPRPRGAAKLEAKGVDLVVANDVSEDGSGFGHPTNHAYLLGSDASVVDLGLQAKSAVAAAVLDRVTALLAGQ